MSLTEWKETFVSRCGQDTSQREGEMLRAPSGRLPITATG